MLAPSSKPAVVRARPTEADRPADTVGSSHTVQRADAVQLTDSGPTSDATSAAQVAQPANVHAIVDAQRGAVGSSFLRLRPWIVGPPLVAMQAMLWSTDMPGSALVPLGAVQLAMLCFFVAEAIWLARAGIAFVTPRRLGASLMITITGLTAAAALTAGFRSPVLPLLLTPVGVAFAAFGKSRLSFGVAAYLVVHLAFLAGLSLLGPEAPRLPMPAAGMIGIVTVAVAAALLWAGVAALTDAHRTTALALDRMRRDLLDETTSRMREMENVGAKVAHEIKNPLTAVKTVLQLGQRSAEPGRATQRFDVALGEVERIEGLVTDYLSYARPLRDLQVERCTALSIVESLDLLLEDRARGIELTINAADAEIVVDPRRLREAILNLALNAVEACEPGNRVAIRIHTDGPSLVIEVRDDGRGMTQEATERATTPFYTSRPGGTGLGLAHARSVARQHGGELHLESELGRGTTATLTIPRYPGSDDGDDPRSR